MLGVCSVTLSYTDLILNFAAMVRSTRLGQLMWALRELRAPKAGTERGPRSHAKIEPDSAVNPIYEPYIGPPIYIYI